MIGILYHSVSPRSAQNPDSTKTADAPGGSHQPFAYVVAAISGCEVGEGGGAGATVGAADAR